VLVITIDLTSSWKLWINKK